VTWSMDFLAWHSLSVCYLAGLHVADPGLAFSSSENCREGHMNGLCQSVLDKSLLNTRTVWLGEEMG
jgi:hypothetical protein